MNIPNQLTLPEIQDFARACVSNFEVLFNRNFDLGGRRVINSGPALAPFDLVTKHDMEQAVRNAVKTETVKTETVRAADKVLNSVRLTGQTAAIASTNFFGGNSGTQFRVQYYLETTTLDLAAGTIQVTISYTDDSGATSQSSAALILTALGRTFGALPVLRASGNISYSTTLTGIIGASVYALSMSLERLS